MSESEYLTWVADTANKQAQMPSPLYVSVARQASIEWAVEDDDTRLIRGRRSASIRSDLTLEWTQPETAVLRRAKYTVLHVHGAAQTGSAASYRPLAAQIAMAIPATVAMLEYRRPPETPFPAVLEDVLDAMSWLESKRRPMSRTILSADSFGAMPALAAALKRKAQGLRLPAGIYLLCPDTDYSNRTSLAGRTYYPNPASCLVTDGLNQYFPPAFPCTCPEATPGLQDLTGLPPILMHESRYKPLAHATTLKEKLTGLGVPFQFKDWDWTPHDFPTYGRRFSETAEAMADLKAWVQTVLG